MIYAIWSILNAAVIVGVFGFLVRRLENRFWLEKGSFKTILFVTMLLFLIYMFTLKFFRSEAELFQDSLTIKRKIYTQKQGYFLKSNILIINQNEDLQYFSELSGFVLGFEEEILSLEETKENLLTVRTDLCFQFLGIEVYRQPHLYSVIQFK